MDFSTCLMRTAPARPFPLPVEENNFAVPPMKQRPIRLLKPSYPQTESLVRTPNPRSNQLENTPLPQKYTDLEILPSARASTATGAPDLPPARRVMLAGESERDAPSQREPLHFPVRNDNWSLARMGGQISGCGMSGWKAGRECGT